MFQARSALIWAALVAVICVPLGLALNSPQLAWRAPVYVVAGFSGVLCLAFLLLQPLLASGYLPGLTGRAGRMGHRIVAIALVVAVIVHVTGLWLTSPPDVIDALLFVSPTPFSMWGVLALWAVFAFAIFAACRSRIAPRHWRLGHALLAIVIVLGTVIHALLIDGTMEVASKAVLCACVVLALVKGLSALRFWQVFKRSP